jgi:hypothetical protein
VNPDLLDQLRALLGPSRTASTPRKPIVTMASAYDEPVGIGPRDATQPTYAPPEPMSRERMLAELGVGMIPNPVSAAPDVARTITSAVQGDALGAAGNAALAGLSLLPLGGAASKLLRGVADNASGGVGRTLRYNMADLGRTPNVPQMGIQPRPVPARGVPADVLGAVRNNRPMFEEYVRRGADAGGLEWYNLDPLRRDYISEIGEEAGKREFGRLTQMLAATSPRSTVAQNIRRAAAFSFLNRNGIQVPDNQALLTEVAPSLGHIAHKTHLPSVRDIEDFGSLSATDDLLLRRPKTSSFGENLGGNYQPVTVDAHNLRAWGLPESRATAAYDVLEREQQDIAARLGIAPAQVQSSAWIGGAGDTNVSDARPFLDNLRDVLRKSAARQGLSEDQTYQNFLRGMGALGAAGTAGALAAEEGEGAETAGGATLAMAGLLMGVPNRQMWGAWHGSPQRNIQRFRMSKAGAAGSGVYVAENDPLGAGRQQALGFLGMGSGDDYFNVGGKAIPVWGQPERLYKAFPEQTSASTIEDLGRTWSSANRNTEGLHRAEDVLDPAQFADFRNNFRENWFEGLSRRADQFKGAGEAPAVDAMRLLDAGTVDVNRPALYRLGVDADRERMLRADLDLADQPEFVRNALRQANEPTVANVAGSTRDGLGFLHQLEAATGSEATARKMLGALGIEGVTMGGGTYHVGARYAPSTQHTIFSPERIRILEMLAAAGILPAANALAQMREPTTPVPPEG